MIKFKAGDATNPDVIDGFNIILHCVNDGGDDGIGGIMGGGIAYSIKNKWPIVYEKYRLLFDLPSKERVTAQGQIQVVAVGKNLFVANLFGQSGIGDFKGFPAVRYDAIEEGLIRLKDRVGKRFDHRPVVIHTCRLGSGLAGGSWKRVEEIFNRVFKDSDIEIVVYDYPGSTFNQ